MSRILGYLKVIYFYLLISYKIWKIRRRRFQKDDIVYTTHEGVEIRAYPGRKPESPYDFVVRYKEPGKKERTPAHIHLLVEMYVKYCFVE